MTREGEIILLREHLSTVARLAERLALVRDKVGDLMPMSAERLKGLGEEQDIFVLAFLKTFEQLEETLARTLKTLVMLMQLGEIGRLTPRDVAYRAVSLGILADGKTWADAVRVRNALAHEYPLDPAKQSSQVNAAWDNSETLFDTARAIEVFVERERLLLGEL